MSKAKERYYWYKSHGICVGCGRADARNGRVYCPQCAADKAYISMNSYYKYREEYRATHNEREKERRQRRIDAGVCTKCGKQKPITGQRLCMKCAVKQRTWANNYKHRHNENVRWRQDQWDGVSCGVCGKPVVPFKKLCPECYEKRCAIMREVNSNRSVTASNRSDTT